MENQVWIAEESTPIIKVEFVDECGPKEELLGLEDDLTSKPTPNDNTSIPLDSDCTSYSKMVFTPQSQEKLLELVTRHYDRLQDRICKNIVWEQIHEEMLTVLPTITKAQVMKKWKNMLGQYKKFVLQGGFSKENRMRRPDYYEEIHSLVGDGITPFNKGIMICPPIIDCNAPDKLMTEPKTKVPMVSGVSDFKDKGKCQIKSQSYLQPSVESDNEITEVPSTKVSFLQSTLEQLLKEISSLRRENRERYEQAKDEDREFRREYIKVLKRKNEILENYLKDKSLKSQ